MAIDALDRMHVVGAFHAFERRIHGLNVDSAVGELRLTGRAGCSRRLAVLFVAGEATEALMNADRGAVVAGTDLGGCLWGVALVAKSLALVRAYLH